MTSLMTGESLCIQQGALTNVTADSRGGGLRRILTMSPQVERLDITAASLRPIVRGILPDWENLTTACFERMTLV
jgi:hypothetical protein